MKKILAILCASALLLSLTACGGSSPQNPGEGSQDQSPDNSAVNSDSSTQSSHESSTSELQKPDGDPTLGEPTFLICPDGKPVYTSEISLITAGRGDDQPLTLEEVEEIVRNSSGNFVIRCDSFAYVYDLDKAVNRVDDPELFEDIGGSYSYLGDVYDVNNGVGECTTDLYRVEAGDKIGSLTVKSACAYFGTNYYLDSGISDIPGTYLIGGGMELEGDPELSGYVCVSPDDGLNGGGYMRFYPDGESSVKLPNCSFVWDRMHKRLCGVPTLDSRGYYGSGALVLDLGKIDEAECNVSGIAPGDEFVKVRIKIGDISFTVNDQGSFQDLTLKEFTPL